MIQSVVDIRVRKRILEEVHAIKRNVDTFLSWHGQHAKPSKEIEVGLFGKPPDEEVLLQLSKLYRKEGWGEVFVVPAFTNDFHVKMWGLKLVPNGRWR